MLANRATYEIMDPLEIGLEGNRSCSASTPAGTRSPTRSRSSASRSTTTQLNRAFARFKDLADRKIQLTDQDLEAIVSEELGAAEEDVFVLEAVQVGGGTALRRRRPSGSGAARR